MAFDNNPSTLRTGSRAEAMSIDMGLRAYMLKVYNYMASADRKSTRLNSSHITISYAVFCLKKKKQ